MVGLMLLGEGLTGFAQNHVSLYGRYHQLRRFGLSEEIAGSSNGRTHGFGPWYRGSSPCPAAIDIYH